MSLEIIGISGFIVALLSFVMGSFFLGGRRWRGNYEAEHTRAERLHATLVEKDMILEGQSDRLARLDGVVQELGGQKVYQAMIDQQEKNLSLFHDITTAIKEGDHQITDAIRDLAKTVEKATNGRENR